MIAIKMFNHTLAALRKLCARYDGMCHKMYFFGILCTEAGPLASNRSCEATVIIFGDVSRSYFRIAFNGCNYAPTSGRSHYTGCSNYQEHQIACERTPPPFLNLQNLVHGFPNTDISSKGASSYPESLCTPVCDFGHKARG